MTKIEEIYIKHQKKKKEFCIAMEIINGVKSITNILESDEFGPCKRFMLEAVTKIIKCNLYMIQTQPLSLPKYKFKGEIVKVCTKGRMELPSNIDYKSDDIKIKINSKSVDI